MLWLINVQSKHMNDDTRPPPRASDVSGAQLGISKALLWIPNNALWG